MSSDYTGNVADACPQCGNLHGTQWQCDPDGLRREITLLCDLASPWRGAGEQVMQMYGCAGVDGSRAGGGR